MIYLNGISCLSPLGFSEQESCSILSTHHSPYIKLMDGYLPMRQKTWLGEIADKIEPQSSDNCRNNRLTSWCLDKIEPFIYEVIKRYSKQRIGIIVGTSTSAITELEEFTYSEKAKGNEEIIYDSRFFEISIISEYIQKRYDIQGPCYTVATACSSSAKAIVAGAELLSSDVCDAVIVGGSDALSKITVSGFFALSALSLDKCRPFAIDRSGINISEAAGYTILTKEPIVDNCITLLGYGQTSDAHHISAPDPSGVHGMVAVKNALTMANLKPEDIGYVNMHGTGTKLNDSMEKEIIKNIFGSSVPVSSTKHITGHTLGASGIVEAYISMLILNYGLDLPYHKYNFDDIDHDLGSINIIHEPGIKLKSNIIMSNNFAFGGSNISLIFGKK